MFEKHSFGAELRDHNSHPEGGVAASRHKIAMHRFEEKRSRRLAMEATAPRKPSAAGRLKETFGGLAAIVLRRA